MATRLFGLLGWPVEHSVSPDMMKAAFQHMGLDAVYLRFPVRPGRLADAVSGLVALGARGANVTIPYKQDAYRLCTEWTEEARLVGAVNTLRFDAESGRIYGHNTDVTGWWESVRPYAGSTVRLVTVLGAGGAARAVVAALALHMPGVRVHIAARRLEPVRVMAEDFGQYLDVVPVDWADLEQSIEQSQWVVQCTPIGMWPHVDDSPVADPACFRPGQLVQDLIYRPSPTKFIGQAAAHGCTVQDGLEMLVQQGARALSWWTGLEAPADVMRHAALDALQRQ
jgi:shikimate dehydrogenase